MIRKVSQREGGRRAHTSTDTWYRSRSATAFVPSGGRSGPWEDHGLLRSSSWLRMLLAVFLSCVLGDLRYIRRCTRCKCDKHPMTCPGDISVLADGRSRMLGMLAVSRSAMALWEACFRSSDTVHQTEHFRGSFLYYSPAARNLGRGSACQFNSC